MRRCSAALWFVGWTALFASQAWSAEKWVSTLDDPSPGTFSAFPAIDMTFAFGWSDLLEAGGAEATVRREAGRYRAEVKGETSGLARMLWRLDATHSATIDAAALTPVEFDQNEEYRSRTIETKVRFDAEGLKRWREVKPSDSVPKWKRVRFTPMRDILSGVLFVRSLPLKDGDVIRLVAFPGDSPYLITVTVQGREKIASMGAERPAIRMVLEVQKLDVKNKVPQKPVSYSKFQSGSVWVSDDELRLPLRAEVNIFIGFVYGELTGYKLP